MNDVVAEQVGPTPRLSILIPVKDEAGNIEPLLREIDAACAEIAPFEVIYIDDGSRDATAGEVAAARDARPHVRVLTLARGCGKSTATLAGVRAARAPIIATMDGDGQNDPVFVPKLFAALLAGGPDCGLAAGQRIGRKGRFKAIQSRIANAVRRRLLGDDTRDTGCGLKCFPRDVYLALPFFDGLHRFLPALVTREGLRVVHVDVEDRPRLAGVSKYGMFRRLWVGVFDLLGVRWLIWRRRGIAQVREHATEGARAS